MEPRRSPLIREAVLDGIFYPHTSTHLREAVRILLLRCEEVAGTASGIVAPHGSLQYCGLHQASAFKSAAARSPKLAVILGAVANLPARTATVPESDVFRTPIGDTTVDTDRCAYLADLSKHVVRDDIPHLQTPSIETALPFIQFLFPETVVLPLLVTNSTRTGCIELAHALKTATGDLGRDDVLWICSTNIARGGNASYVRSKADNLISLLETGDVQVSVPQRRRSRGYPASTCLTLFQTLIKADTSLEVLTRGSSCDVDANTGSSTEYAAIAARRL